MHSEICPVCLGCGKYSAPESIEDRYKTTAPYQLPHPCHGCSGYGWVTVRDTGDPPTDKMGVPG